MPLDKSPAKTNLLKNWGIKAITFDLDDTLWPCAPAVDAAECAYYQWIEKHFPKIAAAHNKAEVIAKRRLLVEAEPMLMNDVTELRRKATIELLKPAGASEADIEEAMRVCIDARQGVSLYPDVTPALTRLKAQFKLGTITNGNACLEKIGIKNLFDSEFAATLACRAKPAPDMFVQSFAALDVDPVAVLHIGDHPINDVQSAQQLGCRTAWINRFDAEYPEDALSADLNIVDLDDLVKLVQL